MQKMKELIKNELSRGTTQRDLASKIGFSHSTIQKILFTNTRCTYETRKKVADYFRVPVEQFYDVDAGIASRPAILPVAAGKRTDISLAELAQKYIAALEETGKLKDQRIQDLERQLEAARGVPADKKTLPG